MQARFISILAAASAASAPLVSSMALKPQSDADPSVWAKLSGSRSRSPNLGPYMSPNPDKRQAGWSPPSDLATPLKEVWDHCLATYSSGLFGFTNYGWDQLRANNGNVNVCVRWESSASVTKEQRDQVATAVSRQYDKWFQWVYGYDNFPYSSVNVNIVGWAVTDTNLLQGSTDDIDVYTTTDSEGAPECAPECGRFFHQDDDYSSCSGGASRHYDQSLWLTDGFEGGAGGDWGQRISQEYFMELLSSENIHILLHELGHTYGLDDFYGKSSTQQD
ncbi:putative cellulose-binding family ii protein [Eutypa lata UCREL1]|uniref:Putative cellulose-binding family ii protein n=1 Tax=Eutypa lata (strain UCR-EL1) TaxID=1287681 RepID=M7SP49_EUTLA|nr:putative cellulose-binding family ii protein [Eutypa lata UCREL1]